MSETFEQVLVKDDRLGCITSKVKFQVFKGGQNITSQPFKAISETTTSHVYKYYSSELRNHYQSRGVVEIDHYAKD